ncbi:MAG: family 20 glycosylhydrolase [Salibacteraceae bacterium]
MLRVLLPLFLFGVLGACQQPPPAIPGDIHQVIPLPDSILELETGIEIRKGTAILVDNHFTSEGQFFQEAFRANTGFALKEEKEALRDSSNTIALQFAPQLKKEGSYDLLIADQRIRLRAGTKSGAFYGLQTLLQMFPAQAGPVVLKGHYLQDAPRFAHRGMLLDCSRHFWSTAVVKQYIDLLASYKMNVLHWHLTEDQGWRIEIKKYPRLTEVGAWRTEADGQRYGGYYTQEEVREVVAYAQNRHVTIIPEIEMPGHSLAALAAYPELGCTGGPYSVTPEWGVFKEVYCAGNEQTFQFLQDVLLEVMDLFPGKYIHIGGDECPKYRWEHCEKCLLRMEMEQLRDAHELQSYFIQRIGKFLAQHDRHLIGWDEILEGGLAEGATVQSWRGMEGGKQAAEAGHYAIMSPTSHCYLDYGLDAIDLEKIYHFEPIPEGLAPEAQQYILGGECNMWTEHVPNVATLGQKVLPRMVGLAEVLWTDASRLNYSDFEARIQTQHLRWKAMGLNYGFATVPIAFETQVKEGGIHVKLQRAQANLQAYFETTGSAPSQNSPLWKRDTLVRQSTDFEVGVWQEGREFERIFFLPLSVHQALGNDYSTNLAFSPYYTAGGEKALTDGIRGSLDFRDGHWQGYQEHDLEIVLSLDSVKTIQSVSAQFYQYINAWIFAPTKLEVWVSADGEQFQVFGAVTPEADIRESGQFIETLRVNGEAQQVRYIKLVARNLGKCPDWHDAAGSPAWLFIDEIVAQ